MAQEDAIAYMYDNDLHIAPKADAVIGCENGTVEVDGNMTDVRRADVRHVLVGVVPDDN